MLYYFKKDKNATEMLEKTCAVCGEGAVTDRRCLQGFVKLCAGDSSLDDAPRSVEVGSDAVETLTENTPCCSPREVAGRPPQNVQINKVIGENERCVFYFTESN